MTTLSPITTTTQAIKAVTDALEGHDNITLAELESNGIEVSERTLYKVLDVLKDSRLFNAVKGTAYLTNGFTVAYEEKGFKYCRMEQIVFIGNNHNIVLKDQPRIKVYISSAMWVDISISYSDRTFINMCLTPHERLTRE
ncbi:MULTISPECIES: hypothetical protein [Bacillus cereus group]|uniref:Uncharacterized protein n=1 Tax=Bacillus thuringiensis TaxID=1428 RepID=A0A9X7ASG4_BACTU|nr:MULTISPECIES: hypothetical protein [Bacillus cereus group]PFT50752.1 hypothetical protein COK72_01755 [Bacillus thuringiensis]PFY22789.1 hypothetical protein COL44_18075 [Bacillus toyonensis]